MMKKLVLAFLLVAISSTIYAQKALPTADAILADAIKQAKVEKKMVFVLFHASWCGWCHKMDNAMNEPDMKPLFDKSFVIKHITVLESKDKKDLENPGGEAMMAKYNSAGFGIPLWFIFDTKGKLLVDSHIRPAGTGLETKGSNIIGCPAAKEECDEFVKALKLTTKLNNNDLAKIYARFRKNDPKYVEDKKTR